VHRRIALNELLVQERLCGALPVLKWEVRVDTSRAQFKPACVLTREVRPGDAKGSAAILQW
jgi:hypothetical protein